MSGRGSPKHRRTTGKRYGAGAHPVDARAVRRPSPADRELDDPDPGHVTEPIVVRDVEIGRWCRTHTCNREDCPA